MSRKRSPNKSILIAAHLLKVHPTAQRKLVPVQVKRLMAEFDLDAIGTIHIVEIDDAYWIVDGQHRWQALMRHGLGEWEVRCELHVNVQTHAEASALFLKLNQKATLAAFDKYLNEVEAGDGVAIGAKRITERHGLTVDRQAKNGNVTCVNTIKGVYAVDDGQTLDDVYAVLVEAQGCTAAAMEGKMIEGLARVLAKYNGEIDRPILVKKLAKYPGGASGLLGDAKGLKRIRRSGLAACVAETIIEAYNSGRHAQTRLPWPLA